MKPPAIQTAPGFREIEIARDALYDLVVWMITDRRVSVTVKYVHHTRTLRVQYMLTLEPGVRIPLGTILDIPLTDVLDDKLLDWIPKLKNQREMCNALLALDTDSA